MTWSAEAIRVVWKTTNGRCNLCGTRRRLKDHGRTWQVDHSRPRASGGTDHGNNLRVACVRCNQSKGTCAASAVRADTGLAKKQRQQLRDRHTEAQFRNGVIATIFLRFVFAWPAALFGGVVAAAATPALRRYEW